MGTDGDAGKGEPHIFVGKTRSLGKHSRLRHRRRIPEPRVTQSPAAFQFREDAIAYSTDLARKYVRLPICSLK